MRQSLLTPRYTTCWEDLHSSTLKGAAEHKVPEFEDVGF
ncbi:MAG: hypothetical protein IV113_06010 [Hydrogenophaga sp.]|nr:hypothetical protein [Hydrogenophaga sp.]